MLIKYRIIQNQDNNKKEISNKKVFNYGFALLKTILSFFVIISHNFKKNTTNNTIILTIANNSIPHVPSFFLMSFYLMTNNLLKMSFHLLLKRLERLLIPYIIWPIIIWIINNSLLNKYNEKALYSYNLLKLQFLYGYGYIPQFWFLWNLVLITILFYIIIFFFRKNYLFIFNLILIVSYQLQYSNYCYNNIFLKLPNYNRYSISRLFGMLPLASTGLIFGSYGAINFIQNNSKKSLILLIIIYNLINKYHVFANQRNGNYYGIDLNIKAICIISIFSLFPSEKIHNQYLKKFLTTITNYSGGIYYLHLSIKYFFNPYFKDIKNGTFFGIIINYNICYLICFFGMLLFRKTTLKYLFF